ncbi:MAG: LysM peptidoglycan-binding domain-containing protein [Chloroflexota bacterium]
MIQVLSIFLPFRVRKGIHFVYAKSQNAILVIFDYPLQNVFGQSPFEQRWPTGMVRRAFVLIALLCLLVSCTRNRPTPEAITLPTPSLSTDNPVISNQPPDSNTENVAPDNQTVVVPEQSPAQANPQPTAQPVVPAVTPAPANEGNRVILYTVQSGDTVASIATKYGITPQTLRELNLLENNYLQAGRLLRVPLLDGYTEDGYPTPTPEPFIHVVQSGETLFGIAAQYGVEATALVAANNITDQNGLTIGRRLKIPGYTASPNSSSSSSDAAAPSTTQDGTTGATAGGFQVVHVVKPGEGLYAIAVQYDVSADAIASANNIQNYELLRVGQRLFIPGVTLNVVPSAPNQQIHVVQAGEGLLQIAVTYGVSAQAIAELNNLADSDLIYPGQHLLIPGE